MKKTIGSPYDENFVHNRYGQILEILGKTNLPTKTYWYGVLYGIMQAEIMGIEELDVMEFGVCTGGTLKTLCEAAAKFQESFGIKINVFGFDNFTGLPESVPIVDHPEMWSEGEFVAHDKKDILAQCKLIHQNITLVDGDVGETVQKFEHRIDSPIGFISIDLDYYSSTKRALPILEKNSEFYLPCVLMYFDDVSRVLTYNPWCGEQLAIKEFNEKNAHRKIHRRFGVDTHVYNLYTCHNLDHPIIKGDVKTHNKFNIFLP